MTAVTLLPVPSPGGGGGGKSVVTRCCWLFIQLWFPGLLFGNHIVDACVLIVGSTPLGVWCVV